MPKRVRYNLGLGDKMPIKLIKKRPVSEGSHEVLDKSKDEVFPQKHTSYFNAETNVRLFITPIKSANDKKDYRIIQLENGLTACLVSDLASLKHNVGQSASQAVLRERSPERTLSEPESSEAESGPEMEVGPDAESTDEDTAPRTSAFAKLGKTEEKMAGASLCINVGSFSDPKSIQGLAHFLEHMVFMGSEKYPIENDFDAFLKKRGGSDNASTDCETTTFHFECQDRDLNEALDKIANFFIHPLMKRDAMTREREAVDSEFQMALPSDSDRRDQLLLSFATDGHPVNTFTWGNLETLRDNVSDNDLYKSLHEFRKRHYSANRMCLAIQGRFSLDRLQELVVRCFSDVPNNKRPPLDFTTVAEGVFNTKAFKRMYYVKPIKDICQVQLTWPLPSLLHKYKSSPHQYVSWLLGHEGIGSLKSYLKKKVWVLHIETGNAGTGIEHNTIYSLFTVNMTLTEVGMQHLREVLDAVFSFIKLLTTVGPNERIFREIQSIKETTFRFQKERAADEIVQEISENMHYYPPEHYLCGSELYLEYDPAGIEDVVARLQPDTVNVMVMTSTETLPEHVRFKKVEKWFQTPYYDQEIPAEWIQRWRDIEVFDDFKLPGPNIYLTNDFTLLTPERDGLPQAGMEYPRKVYENAVSQLWYRADDKFHLPIAYMYFHFITPLSLNTPQTAAMVDCYVSMLLLHLDEESYPAQVAELQYTITSSERGFMLKLDGFNQKLPLLLELILQHMRNFSSNLTEELFEAVKAKQTKYYFNTFLKATRLVKDIRLSILTPGHWTDVEKHAAIQSVSYQKMLQFEEDLFNELYIQMLIQGNVTVEAAVQVAQMVETILHCKSFVSLSALPQYRVRQIPVGVHKCVVESFNQDDSNSTITNYYQAGPTNLRELVIIELLMMIIEEPLFDVLRTKEQLGYHMYCALRNTYGISGFSITVNTQANNYSTDYVDKRIEAFITYAVELLQEMATDEFDQMKHDLIKLKQCVDLHLQEEVNRNWAEITSSDYLFDRLHREVEHIKMITKQDVIEWFVRHSQNTTATADAATAAEEGVSPCTEQATSLLRKISIQVTGRSKKLQQKDSRSTKSHDEGLGREKSQRYQIKIIRNVPTDDAAEDDKTTTSPTPTPTPKVNLIPNISEFKNSLYIYPVIRINNN